MFLAGCFWCGVPWILDKTPHLQGIYFSWEWSWRGRSQRHASRAPDETFHIPRSPCSSSVLHPDSTVSRCEWLPDGRCNPCFLFGSCCSLLSSGRRLPPPSFAFSPSCSRCGAVPVKWSRAASLDGYKVSQRASFSRPFFPQPPICSCWSVCSGWCVLRPDNTAETGLDECRDLCLDGFTCICECFS